MPIFVTKGGKSYYKCPKRSNKCVKYTWNPQKKRYVKVQGIAYRSRILKLIELGRVYRASRPPKGPRRTRKR